MPAARVTCRGIEMSGLMQDRQRLPPSCANPRRYSAVVDPPYDLTILFPAQCENRAESTDHGPGLKYSLMGCANTLRKFEI